MGFYIPAAWQDQEVQPSFYFRQTKIHHKASKKQRNN